ncbi:hypothetical protein J6590_091087 [Homalodisca vitripennis]|nr:hypothetical protein J6590_091087 [Homalodisca vitripennis]
MKAGTNGIAARESQSIFRELEQRILFQKSSDGVFLSLTTFPHRHDILPLHPVDHKTRLVNSYMVEFGPEMRVCTFSILTSSVGVGTGH